MCLFIPSFPFRNIIIMDKDSDMEQVLAHPYLVSTERKQEKERLSRKWLFVNAAHFPHHNYVHGRNTENLVHEELPAPPTFNGFVRGKYFGLGGSVGNILRSKYLKHRQSEDQISGAEEQKCEVVVEDEKKEIGGP